jgi:hypothetical protein
LRPVTTVTSFHHQPEAQHPKSSNHPQQRRPITPSLGQKRTFSNRLSANRKAANAAASPESAEVF